MEWKVTKIIQNNTGKNIKEKNTWYHYQDGRIKPKHNYNVFK